MMTKSSRADGRGHWPKGKSRSTLTAAQRVSVLRKLRRATEIESLKCVARTLGVSDRSVRRILLGELQPTQRMMDLAARL